MTTTPLHIDAALRTTARAADHGASLLNQIPADTMPSPEVFAAVYRITGKTESDRLARLDFRPTPQSEAAWCRSQLRRWAAKEQAVIAAQIATEYPAQEPMPAVESATLVLNVFGDPGSVDLDAAHEGAADRLANNKGLHALASQPLDVSRLLDLYAAADKAREGDSNDSEIEALWDFVNATVDQLGLNTDVDFLNVPTERAHSSLTGHGYTVRIDQPQKTDDLYVPSAVRIEHHSVEVMVGHSPVDNRMVVHIDGEPARIYFNDTLTHGKDQD